MEWQERARKSKIGKKRPDQALVIKKSHEDGKLIKTESQRAAVSERMKTWFKVNGHPRGMLGKKHSKKMKESHGSKVKAGWDNLSEERKILKVKRMIHTRMIRGKYATHRVTCTWKAAWREIGGKRRFFRSKWEANYAHYLEFLKQHGHIKDWLHEPDVFWFEGIKRGCVSYLPDFKVINNDDSFEYHEVKGWMDDRSKTKINRMKKYHPNIKLIVIATKEYKELQNKLGKAIPNWE